MFILLMEWLLIIFAIYWKPRGNHVVEPGWWTVVCNPAKLSSNWLCKALGLVIVILLEIRTLIFFVRKTVIII